MKLLFIADPTEKLQPRADSSLAMLRTALSRGHDAFWATEKEIAWDIEKVAVLASQISECAPDGLPALEEPNTTDITSFDAVFIRKDPPFDESYVRLCWILSLVENRVWMLNRPSLLLRYHEKLVSLEALATEYLHLEDVVPTFIKNLESTKKWVREKKWPWIVTKPFLGYAGGGGVLIFFPRKNFSRCPLFSRVPWCNPFLRQLG